MTFQQLLDEGSLEIGDGYRAQNSELGGVGPIFLRAGHVTDSHIDFTDVERFHAHLADKVRSKMSKVGDTIITTKGNSTGRTSFVNDQLPPFVYSPHLSYWRSRDPNKLCPGFLRYWSQGREFNHQLSEMKTSTDMAPYLSLTDQRRLRITVPPLHEQKALAVALGALDDKIELNRQMNATLEAMAHALFQSWFVNFDPVRAKVEGRSPAGLDKNIAALFPSQFQDSEHGKIPAGWTTPTLSEILTESTERIGTVPAPEYSSTNYGLQLRSERYTKTLSVSSAKNKLVRKGYLVFGLSRRVLNFGLMRDEIGSVSSAYKVFKLDEKRCRADLLERVMRLKPAYFFKAVSASSREGQSVSNDGLGLLSFALPPPSVQSAYYEICGTLFERIRLNERQSYTLATARDTLLPKLLNGELKPNG